MSKILAQNVMMRLALTISLSAAFLSLAACTKKNDLEVVLEENGSTGFAVYLLEGQPAPAEVDYSQPLQLEEAPVIGMEDIVEYHQSDHAILLTEAGIQKLTSLEIPTNGKAFVVCVDNEPIYTGAFWVAFSSLSFDGIIIDPLLVSSENPFIHIDLGYPTQAFFTGKDLRADRAILEVLDAAGKLIRAD